MNIAGSVTLITGGVQGLGRAIVKKLLKDGGKVVVADIKSDVGEQFQSEILENFGENRMKFLKCDVRDPNQLLETFQKAKSIFGSLDIVCNNAGIVDLDPKQTRKIVDINLTAVMEGTYHAIELMSKTKCGNGGLVVNMASVAGIDTIVDEPMYAATKHGVVGFTRTFKMCKEVIEEDGVRVNCLCPYYCDTELIRNGLEKVSSEKKEMFLKSVEMIEKEDVVDAFMMCVNDDKMNGEAIGVFPKHRIFKVDFPQFVANEIAK